nr:class E sortase [Dietzia aurantiaca]
MTDPVAPARQPDPAEPPSAQTGRRPGTGQVAGELLLTAGALLLLFVIYEAFWTNLASGHLQDEATAQLEDRWNNADPAAGTEPAPPVAPPPGQAFARVHLPTLGEDAAYTVLEGTRDEDLRTGPGHYVDTQMPGERGNFALAGHRNGSGAVFQHLDQLNSCDAVVVETASQWMTYRLLPVEADGPQRRAAAERCLTPEQAARVNAGDYSHVQGRHITTPEAIEVISPVPGTAWGEEDDDTVKAAAERLLTLTTCHPQFSNAERLIVHAALVETIPKAGDTRPAALEEH